MFETVLFPTDFSLFNQRFAHLIPALKRLAIQEVVALNVVELGPQIGFASDTFERMVAWKQDAEPRLTCLQQQIEAAGIRCRWRLEMGKPAPEIIRVAVEERVTLIAMVTRARGMLRRALLGSISHDVVCHAAMPVLVLNAAELGRSDSACAFRRVLLATDFSQPAAEALAQVKRLRAAGADEVVVLHARGRRKGDATQKRVLERMQQIRSELEFLGFEVETLVVDGKESAVIDRVATDQEVSLIVIGCGPSAGEHVSLSENVIGRTATPILAVRCAQVGTTL